eukprot:3332951-Prymnesium_polylepis.1
MKEVTAKADALRAAASAELKALQASRIIWRHHLEVRALPHEWTPLMYAVRHGGALEVAQLIEAGANVHATDKYGCTPLHKAAHIGGADGVAKAKLLLKAGAYLEARDRWGQTPLHAATVNEQPATIRYLCRAGASQKAQDGPVPNFGNTPLQVRARHALAGLRAKRVARRDHRPLRRPLAGRTQPARDPCEPVSYTHLRAHETLMNL